MFDPGGDIPHSPTPHTQKSCVHVCWGDSHSGLSMASHPHRVWGTGKFPIPAVNPPSSPPLGIPRPRTYTSLPPKQPPVPRPLIRSRVYRLSYLGPREEVGGRGSEVFSHWGFVVVHGGGFVAFGREVFVAFAIFLRFLDFFELRTRLCSGHEAAPRAQLGPRCAWVCPAASVSPSTLRRPPSLPRALRRLTCC